MIGKTISHYKIVRKIGSGGMGVVYLAEDLELDRKVALKFIAPNTSLNEDLRQKFINEAKSISSLQHHNICTIHEIGKTDNDELFICMDYYEGKLLSEIIHEIHLDENQILDIIMQICAGLKHAHEKNVIHGDIKSSNIFVTSDGIVKILDFGLAQLPAKTKANSEHITQGTVDYMSPEQIKEEPIDFRSDIWSLGIVLYEILTGSLPFTGDYEQAVSYSILYKEIDFKTTLNSSVSQKFEGILLISLQKDKALRFQSVSDIIDEVNEIHNKINGKYKHSFLSGVIKNHKILIPSAIFLLLLIVFTIIQEPISTNKVRSNSDFYLAFFNFENETPDSSYNFLEKALPELLIYSIEEIPNLQIVSLERLTNFSKKYSIQLTKSSVFDICKKENINAVVTGSFYKIDSSFIINTKVLSNDMDLITSAQSKGLGFESILADQINELSKKIKKKLVKKTEKEKDFNIMDVTTNSLEAYKYYLYGVERADNQEYYSAITFFNKAITIDSTFAMAYYHLARANMTIDNYNEMHKALDQALKYITGVSPREKLYIQASDAARKYGRDEANKIYKKIIKTYPLEQRANYLFSLNLIKMGNSNESIPYLLSCYKNDPWYSPVLNLLGYAYFDIGNIDSSLYYLNEYTIKYPYRANAWDTYGDILLMLGEIDDAFDKYTTAVALTPNFGAKWKLSLICALKENYHDAFKYIDEEISNTAVKMHKAEGMYLRGFYHLWLGNFDKAEYDFNNYCQIQLARGAKGTYAHQARTFWWMCYKAGNYEECSLQPKDVKNLLIEAAPHLRDYFEIQCNVANALIKIKKGDLKAAYKLYTDNKKSIFAVEKKDRLKYLNSIVFTEYLLASGHPTEIINDPALIKTIPISDLWIVYTVRDNAFNIDDLIARAYEQNGDIDNTISEYEKLLTYNKTAYKLLINPMYHFKVAELYEIKSVNKKAIIEYTKYIDIMNGSAYYKDYVDKAKQKLTLLKNKI